MNTDMTDRKNSSGQLTEGFNQLTLADSPEAQQNLALALFEGFSALNIYGKKAVDIESITRAFATVLADDDPDDVMVALGLWMRRENKFPTPADIAGLIERGGKPPFSESMFVEINKKDPENRTKADWQYIQEFKAYRNQGADIGSKYMEIRKDNDILKLKVRFLEKDNRKLFGQIDMLEVELAEMMEVKPEPKTEAVSKVQATIDYMRDQGCSEADVAAFRNEMRV